MVFQSYAIWPHLAVSFNNVAFHSESSGTAECPIDARQGLPGRWTLLVWAASEERPATLSLAVRNNSASQLARGAGEGADLLLLDEPLSNLDTKLRERMRSELKRLQRELGITTLYVTHDSDGRYFARIGSR